MIHSRASQKFSLAIVLLLGLMANGIVPHRLIAGSVEKGNVIHQLRIYEIFDDNKKAFHERFRNHAMRIMARYDFKIVATWEAKTDTRTEFIYLLEWPDKETMIDRWAKFMGDREWAEIKKETGAVYGTLVGKIEDRTLILTDYSPRKALGR